MRKSVFNLISFRRRRPPQHSGFTFPLDNQVSLRVSNGRLTTERQQAFKIQDYLHMAHFCKWQVLDYFFARLHSGEMRFFTLLL